MHYSRKAVITGWILVAILAGMGANAAARPSARAVVENTNVYQGESFALQIEISGSENPPKPNLPEIAGFLVQNTNHRSSSVRIVNGKMDRSITYAYLLTPQRTGALVIPAFNFAVDGVMLRTEPIRMQVQQAGEVDGIELRLQLSKAEAYVGEYVQLEVMLLYNQNLQDVNFTVPLLNHRAFQVIEEEPELDRNRKYYRLPVNGQVVIGVQDQRQIDGKTSAVLVFEKIIKPRQSGQFRIEPAIVNCQAQVGTRQRRSVWGNQQEGVYERAAIASKPLEITVKPLPPAGRPANFGGHVGRYQISTTATPTEVNIGDPITLTIAVWGSEYVAEVELPNLAEQKSLSADFRIPADMSPGKLVNNRKIFTQTIRARHADIKHIPALELPFFNTDSGRYEVAKSRPIPLTVNETRVVTAADAEGLGPLENGQALDTWARGIMHNYEEGVLQNQKLGPEQWLQSPGWLALLGLPPILYSGLLLGLLTLRRRNADPAAKKARRAAAVCLRELKDVELAQNGEAPYAVLVAVQDYLGKKLRTAGRALTSRDIVTKLDAAEVDADTAAELRNLFEDCESARYAGTSVADIEKVLSRTRAIISKLDRQLK